MADRRPNRFANHSRATLAAVVVVAVVVLDALAGLLFIPKSDTDFRRPHPYYHHDLVPNVEATSTWIPGVEHPLYTNSLGFKDRAVREVALESPNRRIVFIGDSFTEGVGVPHDSTFVGYLEDSLAGSGVEVLNAGVIGYSPKIYHLKIEYLLENLGLRFDELFVLVDFSDVPNEILYEHFEPAAASRSQEALHAVDKRLGRISYLWYALGGLLADDSKLEELNVQGIPFTTEAENAPLADPEIHNDGYWDETYKYAAPGFELARKHLQKLVELCKRHDIHMSIVVYPWPTNIVRRETDHVNRRFWSDFSIANGLDFIDLYPRFVNELDPRDVYQRYFIAGDVHWSPAGHALVADALLEVITEGQEAP